MLHLVNFGSIATELDYFQQHMHTNSHRFGFMAATMVSCKLLNNYIFTTVLRYGSWWSFFYHFGIHQIDQNDSFGLCWNNMMWI